jgi:hypothetical protein
MLAVSTVQGEGLKWSAYGPGTVSVAASSEKGPGGERSFKVVFKPTRDYSGDYWCGARVEIPSPLNQNEITFYAKMVHKDYFQGIKLIDAGGQAGQFHQLIPADWIEVRCRREFPEWLYNSNGGPLKNIAAVEFIFNNSEFKPGTTLTLLISGLKVSEVKPRPCFNPLWSPVKTPAPVKGYRIETCIHNVWDNPDGWGKGDAEFSGLNTPKGVTVAKDVVEHLIKEYGNVGVTIGYLSSENGKDFSDYFTSLGGLPLAEGHNFPGDDFLKEHNGYAVSIDGKIRVGPDTTHSEDMTNTLVLKALQERILTSAKAGAKAWRSVDYVWPWAGGAVWGYSDSAIKRWRENLNGRDTGIETLEKGKLRSASFWEYAESYLGYRMTPADCGFKSWDDYYPPKVNEPASPQVENRRTLFNLLYHYEWVKYINEAAKPSAKFGLKAQPICNPESFANGTDLAWLFKGAYVRGMAAEWWNTADVMIWNYYTGGYYGRIAQKNGKEIILLGESAAAGGSPYYGKFGRPNYWDNMANYLITYAQSGSMDVKAKHDQYWGSSWKRASNPAEREYQSFTAFRSAWCGFLQCRNDKAFKPKTDVLVITERSIVQDVPSFDRSPQAQPYSLGRDLMELNYLYDGAAFPVDLAYNLDDYRVIVYATISPPKGYAEKLAKWVSADDKRILVTHSFVPTRYAAPATKVRKNPIAYIQEGQQEKVLSFESIQEGTVHSGVLKTHHPIFEKKLKMFEGKRVTFGGSLCEAPGGTVLVSLDDRTLVSERKCGKGRVIYLHFFPNEKGISGRLLEKAIMDAVMEYAGYEPIATSPESIYVLRFDCPDGRSMYLTYNNDARVDMDYHGQTFNVYQAADPDVKGEIRIITHQPKTSFVLTNMITGVSTKAVSDEKGWLPVRYDGWNMMGISVEKEW